MVLRKALLYLYTRNIYTSVCTIRVLYMYINVCTYMHLPAPTKGGGWGDESRYKLLCPPIRKGVRGPTTLHMFLTSSLVSLFVDFTN